MQRHLVWDLATACQACISTLSRDLVTVRLQKSSIIAHSDASSWKHPAVDAKAAAVVVAAGSLACSLLGLPDPDAVSAGVFTIGIWVSDQVLIWTPDAGPGLMALLTTSPSLVLPLLLAGLARSCCSRCSAEAVLCGDSCTGLEACLIIAGRFVADLAVDTEC